MSNVSFIEFLKRSKFNFKKAIKFKEEYSKIMKTGLFDKSFYLDAYPHIKKSGMDPLIHYLFYGYSEGKLPNPVFDNERYIDKYPEIKENNLNPLVYYIDNDHEGFILSKNPAIIKKRRILATNKAFLNNYTFKEEPLVSIIILNRNGLDHLKRLFKDFDKKTRYKNYEIIVVDNASCDESVEYLYSLKNQLPLTIIENNENLSFSKANNDAAKIANGKYLLLLNNDIEPTDGWLNELVGVCENTENVGSVGAKLIFPYYSDIENQAKSFSIQHAGVKFREELTPYIYGPYHENIHNTLIFSNNLNKQKEVIANTAACLLIPKDIYEQLGGLDENYIYGYEDIDFAFKLHEKGYKSIYNPQALLFHHESATREENQEKKNMLNYQNIMHFYEKWKDTLFKELLHDKLSKNYFFTDKPLNFTIITKNTEDKFIKDFIKKISKNYQVRVISDYDNLNLGGDCDVAIVFDKNYPIDKAVHRLNLITIFIDKEILTLNDNSFKIKSKNGKDFSKEILDILEGI